MTGAYECRFVLHCHFESEGRPQSMELKYNDTLCELTVSTSLEFTLSACMPLVRLLLVSIIHGYKQFLAQVLSSMMKQLTIAPACDIHVLCQLFLYHV